MDKFVEGRNCYIEGQVFTFPTVLKFLTCMPS